MKLKLLTLCIISIILNGCNNETQQKPMERPPTKVSTISISEEPIEISSDLTGRVVSSMISEVRPQVSGIIQNRLFEEGAEVKKGQILYQIDPAQYQAAYNQANAALNSAKADITSAKLKNQRYENLVKQKAVAKQEADDAKSSYEKIIAVYEEKKASLEIAKINLEYTKILAPISGIVGISSITPGALVTANQTEPLATIRALNPIYVDLTRSSTEALKLKELKNKLGNKETTPVHLFLEDGSKYDQVGKLKLSEVAVDESTGSVILRAVFDNPDNMLLPGMFVRTKLINGIEEKGIVIPQLAASQNAYGDSFVLVVGKEGKVEQRKVTIFSAYKNKWIISDGLKSGEQVITEGTDKVAAGQTVIIENNKKETGE